MKKKNMFYTMLAITALVVATALPQAQAQKKKKEPPTQVLITNVNVWDGTSDTVKKGVDLALIGRHHSVSMLIKRAQVVLYHLLAESPNHGRLTTFRLFSS